MPQLLLHAEHHAYGGALPQSKTWRTVQPIVLNQLTNISLI